MSTEPPIQANDDDAPWTELFGASLALEDASDLDEIAATLKDAQRAFPEPVEQPPEAYPIYAVSCLLRALVDAIKRLPGRVSV